MDGEGWKQHAPSVHKSPLAFFKYRCKNFPVFRSDLDSTGSADLDPDPDSRQAGQNCPPKKEKIICHK